MIKKIEPSLWGDYVVEIKDFDTGKIKREIMDLQSVRLLFEYHLHRFQSYLLDIIRYELSNKNNIYQNPERLKDMYSLIVDFMLHRDYEKIIDVGTKLIESFEFNEPVIESFNDLKKIFKAIDNTPLPHDPNRVEKNFSP